MSNSGPVLASLAKEINEHDKARRACEIKGVMHACRIGQVLAKAKKIVPHGGFIEWLKANTTVTPRMCQMYMAIARDRRLTDQIEHEYETVSHLTIAKAVNLARQHKTLDEAAEYINKSWAKMTENQKQMASILGEFQSSFDDAGDFKSWVKECKGFSEAFAETIPGLLANEYDNDAWTDAMLANIEAKLAEAQS